MSAVAYFHSPELPWNIPEEEERRYRTIRKRLFVTFLVLALIMPLLPLPQIAREEVEAVPPRLAKLILERQTPPAPKVEQPEQPKSEPKPEKKVEPKKAPEKIQAARAKAERSGLLALKSDLADLRTHSVTSSLQKSSAERGTGGQAKRADRALIASSAAADSGGIRTSSLSTRTGGDGLGTRSTAQVASPVQGGGDGGAVRRGGSGKASRSLEDIKLVFDRNKGAIYTIYNRALRNDPTLQGKVVVKLTIAPDGRVTDCRIVSTELGDPDLERKLVARIKQFDFGARAVDTMVVTYPIDFLPS